MLIRHERVARRPRSLAKSIYRRKRVDSSPRIYMRIEFQDLYTFYKRPPLPPPPLSLSPGPLLFLTPSRDIFDIEGEIYIYVLFETYLNISRARSIHRRKLMVELCGKEESYV